MTKTSIPPKGAPDSTSAALVFTAPAHVVLPCAKGQVAAASAVDR